jgi:hypothetical protein
MTIVYNLAVPPIKKVFPASVAHETGFLMFQEERNVYYPFRHIYPRAVIMPAVAVLTVLYLWRLSETYSTCRK